MAPLSGKEIGKESVNFLAKFDHSHSVPILPEVSDFQFYSSGALLAEETADHGCPHKHAVERGAQCVYFLTTNHPIRWKGKPSLRRIKFSAGQVLRSPNETCQPEEKLCEK